MQQPVTQLLAQWRDGDERAFAQLSALMYEELRQLAQRHLRRERSNHTIQKTALVNEAFVRLVGQQSVDWQSRAHFIGLASKLMRRVLVDYARERNTRKRGGRRERVTLTEAGLLALDRPPDLLALDGALTRLAELDGQKAEIVELRFFGGWSIEETAASLGVSPATVNRQWRRARAWLFRELSPPGALDPGTPAGP
jgi:RNA polymerase sigma-70 factor, ECF subfamily